MYVSLIALFILCPLFSKKLCSGDLNSFNKFISSIEFEILRNEIQDKLDLVNRNKCIITRNQFDAFDIAKSADTNVEDYGTRDNMHDESVFFCLQQ